MLAFAASARAQDVYIRSKARKTSTAELRRDLPAFQIGVNKFQQWWGGEPTTLYVGKAPAGAWQMTVMPAAGFFSPLGYHFLGPNGTPYAIVNRNWTWTQTLTHELFEMVADPNIVRTQQGSHLWLVEVCDPVENLGWMINGVNISDFVGPDWYKPKSAGPYDYIDSVQKPEQIMSGGYAPFWDGTDWSALFGPGNHG